MTKYPPLLFLGNESLSTHPDYDQVPILDGLVAAGWPISAIVIKSQPAVSRKPIDPAVSLVAKKNGIDLVVVNNKDELEEVVDRYAPQLGLLASFGLIIPQRVIGKFALGVINVHPSLLPAYRGTTPIESAICDGQTKTGVSLIQTVAAMDTGPVYAQQAIDISSQISKFELTTLLGRLAADLVVTTLPKIAKNKIEAQKQDEAQASYTRPLNTNNRPIDWSQPARNIEQRIRSLAGWPGSTTKLAGREVRIIEVVLLDDKLPGHPGRASFDAKLQLIAVDCQLGQIGISKLQVPGKKPISAESFVNGYGLGGDG